MPGKYYFDWGSAPDPAGGDYSASLEPLAGRGQPTYKGMGRKEGKGGEDRGRKEKERNGKKCSVPPPTFE